MTQLILLELESPSQQPLSVVKTASVHITQNTYRKLLKLTPRTPEKLANLNQLLLNSL